MLMPSLAMPPSLLAGLDDAERGIAATWWDGLDAADQLEFVRSWDVRADSGAWVGVVSDGRLEWHPVPMALVGRFVGRADRVDHALAKQQLFDFVANHEEIQFFLVEGRFHICRSHPAAREVIRQGWLPADFRCPLEDRACPMRAILAVEPGRSVVFDVVPAPPRRG